MPTKSTWYSRNGKLILVVIGAMMIAGSVSLYALVPQPPGSAASGQGFSLPFAIVLLVLGALIIPSPVHAILKAYVAGKVGQNAK